MAVRAARPQFRQQQMGRAGGVWRRMRAGLLSATAVSIVAALSKAVFIQIWSASIGGRVSPCLGIAPETMRRASSELARTALANSYNVPAVKVEMTIGVDRVVDMARRKWMWAEL